MPPVAFVTGASSGLGRALALRLAEEGWWVGAAARRAPLLESLARDAGGRVTPYPCDVTSREAVGGAVRACAERLGPVDLLVANAGQSEMTDPRSLDAGQAERLVAVNFLGAVYAVEAALPSMLERGSGHLVAVGSLAGYGGLPLSAAYSASKGALHNFFESLRVDLAPRGVHVTVVTPGYVDTDMTRKNLHPMPFLLTEEDAVRRMMDAIRGRKRLAAFPLPLAAAVRGAQLLPTALYDRLASRLKREKRPEPPVEG